MAKKKTEPVEVTEVPTIGRPSSFDPDYLRQAEFLCSQGAATDNDLADFFQVTTRTINRWKIAHPEFTAAIRRGKEAADNRIEDSLYHKAQEREIEEEQAIKVKTVTYNENGKRLKEEERVEIVMVKKIIPADTTAMIFWLKNRRAQQWRDVHKHEHGRAGEFDNLTLEELNAKIVEEVGEMGLLPPPAPEPKSGRKATKH